MKKVGVITGVVVAGLLLAGAIVGRGVWEMGKYQEGQEKILSEAKEELEELYENEAEEVPRKNVTAAEIDAVQLKVSSVGWKKLAGEKEEILEKLERLRDFAATREKLRGNFVGGVLKTEVTEAGILEIEKSLEKLPESYQGVLKAEMVEMKEQYQAIGELRMMVAGLFSDMEMTEVKKDLKRAEYNTVIEKAKNLPQRGVAEKYNEVLARADKVLTQREKEAEEARQRAIEARRRAEELRRQQEREVAGAWKSLNVPYHSQNLQRIYNGCEAASLLMALQYKGYLKGVNLGQYAEMIPKSDDPYTGFVSSIYDLQPKSLVHWIAPAPLAKFGRESSGNPNVIDITGASLDDLDKEVAAGNPVVIYVTFVFKPLKQWLNGAPSNLHVVLLTGYNEKTGAQRLTDPWTQANGGRTYDVPKVELEKLYDGVGRRAVVVR